MPDALQIAYVFLNRRERTVAEVRTRLEQAECDPEAIEAVLAELLEFGYLDDARYARLFVEDRRNLDGWGAERIARRLAEKGIERDVVAAALAAGGEPAGELARARELLAARPAPTGEDPRERERAFAMLVRKGYDSEVAADAVREWVRGARSGS